MKIVDTHLHCWDRDRFRYDWLVGTDLPWSFTPADVSLATDDDFRGIFMEADRAPEQALEEVDWALNLERDDRPEAVPSSVRIVSAVAHAPLGTGSVKELDALSSRPGVSGIRRLLQDERLDFFSDEVLAADLRHVGERGLVFEACVRAYQLAALADLADVAPETIIVLNHLGKPDIVNPDRVPEAAWVSGISDLARRDNVRVKLSGVLPANNSYDAARPYVDVCLAAFGTERAVVGSDWPVSRVSEVPYEAWFNFVLNECGLGADEMVAVSHRNAERLYRLAG